MRLFRHHTEIPVEARGAVVALGNFDGIHIGHQRVIDEAARIAAELRAPCGVLTFEPHPREYFQPDRPPFRLTPFRIKLRQFEAMGLDYLYLLAFDHSMAERSPESFIIEVLGEGIEPAHVVVGYDFVFGRGRSGNAQLLGDLGRAAGFAVTSVSAASDATGIVYSSTKVRERLGAGDPLGAALLLGRPWEIEGRVETGDQRGRQLGFPTANIALGEYLQPALGVYAVKTGIDEGRGTQWHDGVANLGRRPTVGGTRVQLEAHLFDFAGDLYGRHLRVALVDFIRPERKFDGLDALKAQIAGDSREARTRLAAYAGPPPGHAPACRRATPAARAAENVYESGLRPQRK
ncbi:MAG: riboflavin kinase / adenylyltransferase [Rhodospirillaceae bacterium]|jgi:riboflavin kinase/FMN adenylyltransferase|nr:riboflavin kinase / adenylyltransferase [Rhodospirillaceae bacterium]